VRFTVHVFVLMVANHTKKRKTRKFW